MTEKSVAQMRAELKDFYFKKVKPNIGWMNKQRGRKRIGTIAAMFMVSGVACFSFGNLNVDGVYVGVVAAFSLIAIGFVISGFANIEFVDYLGFRHILGSVGAGDIFAESYVLTGNELTVSVVSSTESKIALIPWKGVMERAGDEVKGKILFSLTQILAHKNRLLSSRIFITSEKSIRDKVLAFLSYQSLINSSLSFSIPFDREELSSYLGVDRSALSRELGKMRNEGLLEYRKNHFTLKADGNVFSKSE